MCKLSVLLGLAVHALSELASLSVVMLNLSASDVSCVPGASDNSALFLACDTLLSSRSPLLKALVQTSSNAAVDDGYCDRFVCPEQERDLSGSGTQSSQTAFSARMIRNDRRQGFLGLSLYHS